MAERRVGEGMGISWPGKVTITAEEIEVGGFVFTPAHESYTSCRTAVRLALVWAINRLADELETEINADSNLNDLHDHRTSVVD